LLPANYLQAVQSLTFPERYDNAAFFPPDFFSTSGEWILLGREGGPMAVSHLGYPFSGRSTFLVFLRLPDGRQATLDYIQAFQEATSYRNAPNPPPGTEVALVRRMMLIDQSGNIVLSPIIESVQLRHFIQSGTQFFYEFILNRDLLFAEVAGGFRLVEPTEKDFLLFFSHGMDWFELAPGDIEHGRAEILGFCENCHLGKVNGVASILSFSRFRFNLERNPKVILEMTTPEDEARRVIGWKMGEASWKELQNFWKKPAR
jgi:hypothetical protein